MGAHMRIEVKVPALPESVADATLAKWHKQAGQAVRRDENLVDLETDKVMLEIVAPQDGVLAELKKSDGTVVKSGEVVAVIDTDGAAQPAATAAPAAPTKAQAAPADAAVTKKSDAPPLSPAVRKRVAEQQIDVAGISGTGKGGRVTKGELIRHAEQATPYVPASSAAGTTQRGEQRVPMTRLRARIAERLVEAQHTAAMLTTFNEVNMQPKIALRKHKQKTKQKKHGLKLGFMSFFIKAAVEALKHYPAVNASIDGGDILYHDYFDIGVAVSTSRGLVVPIVRAADALSFAQLEQAVLDYANRARDGKLTLEELTGGTFTITNGGVFGSLLSTPILNPPQSAILGMHKIAERAMVEDGVIVARPMMYLALSYDHRIIDGHAAVRFLVTKKDKQKKPTQQQQQV